MSTSAVSTPTIEPTKIGRFCDKLSFGIQKTAIFAKEQGLKALIALRDLAKRIVEYVGPHLRKGKDFAVDYSKTHKDQLLLLGTGAAVGGIIVGVISKMWNSRSNGNPEGDRSYRPL